MRVHRLEPVEEEQHLLDAQAFVLRDTNMPHGRLMHVYEGDQLSVGTLTLLGAGEYCFQEINRHGLVCWQVDVAVDRQEGVHLSLGAELSRECLHVYDRRFHVNKINYNQSIGPRVNDSSLASSKIYL